MYTLAILFALPPAILAQTLQTSSSSTTETSGTPTTTQANDTSSPSPSSTGGSNPNADRSDAVRYYFVFVVIVLLVLVVAIWAVFRRNQKRKFQSNSARQTALAQDLDGWPNTRRWNHGNWRSDRNRQYNMYARREEGLDELGQAPPPYQSAGGGHPVDTSTRMAVPAPAFTAQDAGHKPPDYHEAFRNVQRAETRPEEHGSGQISQDPIERPSHPTA